METRAQIIRKRQTYRQKVADLLTTLPSLTVGEIAALTGTDRKRTVAAVIDLQIQGVIVSGKKRRCSRSGRTSYTWRRL